MDRIEITNGVRIDATGAGIIVKQRTDGTIELEVLIEGATAVRLSVPVPDAD